MKTKQQQQKKPLIKNHNLNLNVFLHSITYFSNKEINKHFVTTLGNTNDVKFSLNNFLDFDPIKIYFKSHVLSYLNGKILNITFKFTVGLNIQLIFSYFYASRKKH
jgi:hypothetical protein